MDLVFISLVLFGLVLWHTNHCRLFNTESYLYIYIKYDLEKRFVDIITKRVLNSFFPTVKWLQVLLFIINHSINTIPSFAHS